MASAKHRSKKVGAVAKTDLRTLGIPDWNDMVGDFHGESDRGAAVLAAGFVDFYLTGYMRSLVSVADTKFVETLFDAFGPLSSFSQRIAVAYAFGSH